jgi:integrase
VGKSSLRVSLAALAYYHRRSGKPWASNHPIIASVMKGILRQQKRPVQPAAALTSTEIKAMLRTCGDDLASLRERALLLTGFAGGLRRSELVALDVGDIRITKDGIVNLTPLPSFPSTIASTTAAVANKSDAYARGCCIKIADIRS